MRKYKSSVKNNNNLKKEILNQFKNVLYKLENKKYNTELNPKLMKELTEEFKEKINDFDNAVGVGNEKVDVIFNKTKQSIANFQASLNQEFSAKVEDAFKKFANNLDDWIGILQGMLNNVDEEEKETKKQSKARKIYDELNDIKKSYYKSTNRIEKNIKVIETELVEIEDRMLKNQNNNRVINELYSDVVSKQSNIELLDVKKQDYSKCCKIFEKILIYFNELIEGGKFSEGELIKAKHLMNLEKLKETINDPKQALKILKFIDNEVHNIKEKHETKIDQHIPNNLENTQLTPEAQQYMENLIQKRKKSGNIKEISDDIDLRTITETKQKRKDKTNIDNKGEN